MLGEQLMTFAPESRADVQQLGHVGIRIRRKTTVLEFRLHSSDEDGIGRQIRQRRQLQSQIELLPADQQFHSALALAAEGIPVAEKFGQLQLDSRFRNQRQDREDETEIRKLSTLQTIAASGIK